MIKLVTFLGNPGAESRETRHNIGWMVAEKTSFTKTLDWQNKFRGAFGQALINGEKIFFLKPSTFMNRSGESVQALLRFYKFSPSDLLAVHDDIELDFGQIDFKKGGGLGGHNGLRSIVSSLGTQDFHRFRLGISRPSRKDVSGYVLGKFSPEERKRLDLYLEIAACALEDCLQQGFGAAEKKYKKKMVL